MTRDERLLTLISEIGSDNAKECLAVINDAFMEERREAIDQYLDVLKSHSGVTREKVAEFLMGYEEWCSLCG